MIMTYREWLAMMQAEDPEFKAWTSEEKIEAFRAYLQGEGLDV